MLKKKRIFAVIISALMVTSVFTGCGTSSGSGSDGEKVTLTWETHKTDKANTTLRALADKYHNLHPNITIKIEAEKDSDGVMKTRAAGGELPDLSDVIGSLQRVDYPKYYTDISDLGFNKSNFYMYNNGAVNGKLYVLNSAVTYMGIIYNKQSFKKAGITSVPKTIDEFYADCEKIKNAGMVPLLSDYKDGWPLGPYSQNGNLPREMTGKGDYDNTYETKDPFDDPNGLLFSFKFMRNMKDKGYLEKDLMSTSWDNSRKDMAQGKIAMAYLGSWCPPQIVDNGAKTEDIGMFPFPGVKALVLGGDTCFGIAKNSKHIKETKEFLKWMFKDAKYQNAIDEPSPIKGSKTDIACIKELLSYNVPVVEEQASTDKVSKIWKESEINLTQSLQDYMTTPNPDKLIKDLNAKFADARKTVAGQ